MPSKLDSQFTQIVERAKSRKSEFPAKQLTKAMIRFLEDNVNPGDVNVLKSALQPLVEVMDRYTEGLKVHEYEVFCHLLDQYYDVRKALVHPQFS